MTQSTQMSARGGQGVQVGRGGAAGRSYLGFSPQGKSVSH